MLQKPVFSVIVPTYNREHLLKRAVESILGQTFQEFELIIVDDGSTDHTRELVESYKDERLLYIYKENGGINSARNLALENARGEYVAFCDSDDKWLPEKLEKHLQKYQEDLDVKVVYDLTGIVVTENMEFQIVAARNDVCEGWCYREVLEQGYLTSPTFLSCKRECFDKIGMMTTEFVNCEDDDFCFRLCRYFKVGLVKEILGIYHSDALNRISEMKKLCADDFYMFLEKWRDEILEVCGCRIMAQKYFKSVEKYLEIGEMDRATEVYGRACETEGISIEEVKKLIKEKLSADGEIIIYGIGDWGERIYQVLRMVGFEQFVFAVTRPVDSIGEWHGGNVREIGNIHQHRNSPLIIASSKYYEDMKKMAVEKGFANIYSYNDVMKMMFFELLAAGRRDG